MERGQGLAVIDRQTFKLPVQRSDATAALARAPDGYVCEVRPPRRNNDQSAKFHAICHDLAKSNLEWSGKRRDADEWKFLLVSAHAVATKEPGELLLGLENERVMLRESTAAMSVGRMSSLLEYAIAWATSHGVQLRETA